MNTKFKNKVNQSTEALLILGAVVVGIVMALNVIYEILYQLIRKRYTEAGQ